MRMRARRGGVFGLALLACGMPAVAAATREAPPQQPPIQYDPHGRRDPFVPLVRDGRFMGVEISTVSGGGASSMFLGGILWDAKGASIALINGEEAKVGDDVAGYHVAEIRKDAVILMRDGKPLVLQVSFDEPKGGG